MNHTTRRQLLRELAPANLVRRAERAIARDDRRDAAFVMHLLLAQLEFARTREADAIDWQLFTYRQRMHRGTKQSATLRVGNARRHVELVQRALAATDLLF